MLTSIYQLCNQLRASSCYPKSLLQASSRRVELARQILWKRRRNKIPTQCPFHGFLLLCQRFDQLQQYSPTLKFSSGEIMPWKAPCTVPTGEHGRRIFLSSKAYFYSFRKRLIYMPFAIKEKGNFYAILSMAQPHLRSRYASAQVSAHFFKKNLN